MNPAGGLVWSTYLGGGSSDAAYGIAADALGNGIAGLTQSGDLPLLNPAQNFNGGAYGRFVSKLSSGWAAGVFVNGSWYIDRNRNGGFDNTSEVGDQISLSDNPATPRHGTDWTGSGTVKIGVFRSGQWLLDCNGNGVWDGVPGGDCLYNFGPPPVTSPSWATGMEMEKPGSAPFAAVIGCSISTATDSGMARRRRFGFYFGSGSYTPWWETGRAPEHPRPVSSSTAPGISIPMAMACGVPRKLLSVRPVTFPSRATLSG